MSLNPLRNERASCIKEKKMHVALYIQLASPLLDSKSEISYVTIFTHQKSDNVTLWLDIDKSFSCLTLFALMSNADDRAKISTFSTNFEIQIFMAIFGFSLKNALK